MQGCQRAIYELLSESVWTLEKCNYDALRSYGSPSYYMQQMFSQYHGDVVLPTTLTATGGSQVYASVTRDSRTGTIYLKVVNAADEVQPVSVTVKGVGGVKFNGTAVVLTSASPQDTNTLSEPTRVVPVSAKVGDLSGSFDYSFAPYSVTVLQIQTK